MSPQRRHASAVMAVLGLGAMAVSVLQSLVIPALPLIRDELGTTTGAVTWVVTAYLLSAAVATPIAGRFGDMFGKRRMLVITLLLLAAGTLAAALADSIALLIASRVLQGVGSAVFPLAYGIIRDELAPRHVAMGIALMSTMLGIGGGFGTVLSGPIVASLGYHWLFWLPLAPIGAATLATIFLIPDSPHRAPGRVNWIGALLLAGWLVALLLAFSFVVDWGWTSPRFIGLVSLAAILATLWIRQESASREPLVDMAMMRRRGVWTTNLAGLVTGFGMLGSFILIPQLVELPVSTGFGFGASVTQAGLFMLPSTLAMLVISPIGAQMARHTGAQLTLTIGMGLMAAAYFMLALAHSTPWDIVLVTTLIGLGVGLSYSSLANLIVEAVPRDQTGVATGMNTIMRMIGASIGGQVTASLVAGSALGGGLPGESGFTAAFLLSAIVMTAGVGASLLVPRPPRHEPAPASAAGVSA